MTTHTTPGDKAQSRLAFAPPLIRIQRRLAWLLLILQGGITVTGSIVRVTGSGLGCDTWPYCHEGTLVPRKGAAPWIHQAIEFGNRTLTFVLVAAAAALLLSVLRAKRRKGLVNHALFQCVGIVVQAVIGGISVHLDLRWWAVALHFLPSMILVWAAAVMVVRVSEPDDGEKVKAYDSSLRGLAALCGILLTIVLVTGTMVTGAGPHSGDSGVGMDGRLEVDIDWMAHVHAWSMYVFLAFVILLVAGLALMQAPQRAKHLGFILACTIVVQAAVGIMQYRLGVPSWSVPLHIGLCSFVVAAAGMLWAVGMDRIHGGEWITGSAEGDNARQAYLQQ